MTIIYDKVYDGEDYGEYNDDDNDDVCSLYVAVAFLHFILV